MRVISLVNQKGGVGKTTTSVNLAYYLAQKGKKVLLIDIDPQGNATMCLDLDKKIKKTTSDFLRLDFNVIEDVLHNYGVDLIPTNDQLAGYEIEITNMQIARRENILHEAISKLVPKTYDFVLIDCPPSLDWLTINALYASTDILIIMQAEYLSLEGINMLVKTLKTIQQVYGHFPNILGVLMTMFRADLKSSKSIQEKINETPFKDLIFKTKIRRNSRLTESSEHGCPIGVYDAKANGAKDYEKFTNELMEVIKNDN